MANGTTEPIESIGSNCTGIGARGSGIEEPSRYHRPVRLILASASPRRAELLTAAGFEFDVQPVEVDETPRPGEDPAEYVARLASAKARALVSIDPHRPVLAADTTVVVDGQILGKPQNGADARRMLALLSGRGHDVLTGVALRLGERVLCEVERTKVVFLPLDAAEVEWYVASGEPADKAGAYAVQGLAARFVDRIEGSYSNVVGLPIARVHQMVRAIGIETVQLPR
jgi:septum formation protein